MTRVQSKSLLPMLATLGALTTIPVALGEEVPLRVEVEPNALQRVRSVADGSEDGTRDPASPLPMPPPMTIEVWGATPGEPVYFEVLRDCDNDKLADRVTKGACESPLATWSSPPTDTTGYLHSSLDFSAQTWDLPDNVGLWLHARRSPESSVGALVPFGLLSNACDLWRTLVDTFFDGKCDAGLLQALRRHKGPAGLEDVTFEVRRLVVEPRIAEPVPVPNTLGATGVAWADETTLIVARAPVVLEVPAVLPTQERAAAVPPGLYRIDLADDEPASELLWQPASAGLMPAAPFSLQGGEQIAFVRQSLTGDLRRDEQADVLLSFWKDGALESEVIPLPYRIHQILAASDSEDRLLALSLGLRSNRPTFLRIHWPSRSVAIVGYHHGLYHAALRVPNGGVSAISFEDASGRWGWELMLVDEKGEWVEDLVHRKHFHDLMPTWRPNGGEMAYLAEVSRIERRSR